MELPTTLLGYLLLGLTIIITAISALGVRAIIAYSKANIQNDLFDRLSAWASTYVKALAQDPSLEGLASEEKKERAMFWIVSKAEELGITITTAEASQMIEEAVWLLKNSALPAVADALA